MYRSTPSHRTDLPSGLVPVRVYVALMVGIILILGLVGAVAQAAEAGQPSPNVAAVRAATTPIDTGTRAEDQQPSYTQRLAAAGWDYNPGCMGRFDWFPVGHPCNARDDGTALDAGRSS